MKTYAGTLGPPAKITVASGKAKPRALKFRPTHTPAVISWKPTEPSLGFIVLAILDDILRNPDRALRLMHRFKWRVAPNWKDGHAWTLTDQEALAVIADIEAIERQAAPGRQMVALEPAPIVSDRAADVTWTKQPKLKINQGKP